jgi:cellulose synthase (UDP-forming)
LPTQSITEDQLLSITMLRKGYVTRYLCERLAFGLATLDAFLTQRQRWARGAIQILYLANGPLGRNLTLMQRLLFLPMHWLSQGLRLLMAIVAPIIFLWTGISPVFDVTAADVLYYLVPMVLALAGGVWAYADGQHFPLASQVQGTFSKLQDPADRPGNARQALRPSIQGHAKGRHQPDIELRAGDFLDCRQPNGPDGLRPDHQYDPGVAHR